MKNSIKKSTYIVGACFLFSCNNGSNLVPITPDVITEKTMNDTDDPAIWINPEDASKSIVFGTDKETNGAIYAFDLEGKIIEDKTIRNIQRPNNIDLEYGFQLSDSIHVDIITFTEREKQQIRIFSVPDMKPLDQGGFPVFKDETNVENRLPMGVALYKSPIDSAFYVIVGRKTGPEKGYLYQYKRQFNLFDRETNEFIKAVNLTTNETDGCDVVTVPLNNTFSSGLFVAMNDQKDFYFYDLNKLLK